MDYLNATLCYVWCLNIVHMLYDGVFSMTSTPQNYIEINKVISARHVARKKEEKELFSYELQVDFSYELIIFFKL